MRLRRVVVHADSLGLVQKTIEILLLLCGGESFSSDDASDSELDSVMPTKGKYTINSVQYQDVRCVAMSCGGENFSPDGAPDSALDSVLPTKGKYTINYIQYQGVRCVAISCGGENFSPDGVYDSALDSVLPTKGNTPSITSSTLVDVGCVCMLNWICNIGGFCADNHNYFQFKLDGKGRSAGSAAIQVQVCGETVVLSQLLLRLVAVHC